MVLLVFRVTVYAQADSLKGGELYSSNFLIDNIQRNFTYYMPLNYGMKDLYPLVIFLHGQHSNSKNVIKNYGGSIHTLADTFNCVVIYPDAVNGHWNVKMNTASGDSINNVGFISILIDYFRDVYHCDPKRVYVAGISNGGAMAYRLACNISFKIAAVAPFVSNIPELTAQCKADASVAMTNAGNNENPSSADIANMWKFFMQHYKE